MGNSAFATGSYSNASGDVSSAFGYQTTANGANSWAAGKQSRASGYLSTTFGWATVARGHGCFAIGNFNDSISTAIPNDTAAMNPMFIVGNGKSNIQRSNAMVVLFNGNAGLGVNNPSSKLEIRNGTLGFSCASKKFELSYDSANNYFYIDEYGFGKRLAIKNGNVGICTTNPVATLDVNGSAKIGNKGTVINNVQTGEFTAGSGGATGVNSYTINFPVAYTTIPKVNVTVKNGNNSDMFLTTVKTVSTSQIIVNVYRIDILGGSWGTGVYIDWMAWE
jgi:hypothetical protein